jgi:hypothetical protein
LKENEILMAAIASDEESNSLRVLSLMLLKAQENSLQVLSAASKHRLTNC